MWSSCSRPVAQGQCADRRGRRSGRDRGHRQGPQDRRHPDDGSEVAGVPGLQAVAAARRGRRPRRGRPADHRRARPTRRTCCGSSAPRGAAAPGRRGPGGLPLAGRVDPRQAHRDHRSADAAPDHGDRLRRDRPAARSSWSTGCVRGGEPPGGGRGRQARLRSSGADGHHQGVAGHRVVAVGGFVPGDDPRAHRRGDPRQVGLAASV